MNPQPVEKGFLPVFKSKDGLTSYSFEAYDCEEDLRAKESQLISHGLQKMDDLREDLQPGEYRSSVWTGIDESTIGKTMYLVEWRED